MKNKYLAFYKPYGVLSTFTDDVGRETIKNYISIPEIYSAGRLDMDSEGLLLLTNDGALIHALTTPQYQKPKTYLVQVEGLVTTSALAQLSMGVKIKGYQTAPCRVREIAEPILPPRRKPITPHAPTTWLEMILHEGKKRQIRHMSAAVGFPTLRLVRVAIGCILLGELQPGEWRHLSPGELHDLRSMLNTNGH